MGENSKIEWCRHTFNCWRGCEKKKGHPGCAHCYAEVDRSVRIHDVQWGSEEQGGTRFVPSLNTWRQPEKWNREAYKVGERHRVFCASLGDVFEDWRGPMHGMRSIDGTLKAQQLFTDGKDWFFEADRKGARPLTMTDARERLFRLIDSTPHLDWMLLTKRPENIRRMWPRKACNSSYRCLAAQANERMGEPVIICPDDSCDGEDGIRLVKRDNVWLGTSVSNQRTHDKYVPKLLQCHSLAAKRFVSAEPLTGPIDFKFIGCPHCGKSENAWLPNYTICRACGKEVKSPPDNMIDLVITGGESGPRSRGHNLKWSLDIGSQCEACAVAWYHKQHGSKAYYCDEKHDSSPIVGTRPVSCNGDSCSPQPVVTGKGNDPEEWIGDQWKREIP